MATTKVTTGGITDATIATADIADQAVTLAKLPHGTSSNDGKFLRANNGADPTFETITGTTINNNANNRIITGSSTANTLEGEANLTYDGGGITLTGTNPYIDIVDSNNDSDFTLKNDNGTFEIEDKTNSSTARLAINSSVQVGIVRTPTFKLDVEDSTNNTLRLGHSGETGHGSHDVKIVAGRNYYHNFRFEGSSYHFFGFNGSNTAEHFRIRSTGGVTFNGDTADANALDDYEEGTWTPQFYGATATSNIMTTSTNVATYIKIGRLVYVRAWVVISNLNSASGSLSMKGLPYSYSGNYTFIGHQRFENVSNVGNISSVLGYIGDGSQVVNWQYATATSTTAMDVNRMANNTNIMLTFSYPQWVS